MIPLNESLCNRLYAMHKISRRIMLRWFILLLVVGWISFFHANGNLKITSSTVLAKKTNENPLNISNFAINPSVPEVKEDIQPASSFAYKLSLVYRAVYLFIVFLPLLLTSVFAYCSVWIRIYFWFPLVALSISHSGAAFIKWGQWASTRSDIFPRELCIQLSSLQSAAPFHSFAHSRFIIEQSFACPLETLFDHFDPTPIASGSIAQIHRAIYKGKEVAVKVRHPAVVRTLALDFTLMSMLVSLLHSLPFLSLHWLRLQESLIQFSNTLAAQTDLRREADSLLIFAANFNMQANKAANKQSILFPTPILAKEDVLFESYLANFTSTLTLIDQLTTVQTQLNKKQLANTEDSKQQLYEHRRRLLHCAHFVVTQGEDLYLQMLIKDHFMHADLHPGNILLQFADKACHDGGQLGSQSGAVRGGDNIALVDAGLVTVLTAEQQVNFIGLISAIGRGDGRAASSYVLQFSLYNDQLDDKMIAGFTKEMEELFQRLCQPPQLADKQAAAAAEEVANIDLGDVLRGILAVVQRYRVTIEANYATLVVNALCLDGMAKQLLPSYNVLAAAREMLSFHDKLVHLPSKVGSWMRRHVYPWLARRKTKRDQQFLQDLLKKTDKELDEIYGSSRIR